MILANIATIKNHFTEYLRKVARGEEVGVCRRNVLVARIRAVEGKTGPNRTRLGRGKATVIRSTDLTSPMMPVSDWDMLESGGEDEAHS